MTPADYDSFCEVVVGFAELKGKQLSAPALALYWRAMQHWSIADFRAAAERLLSTCEFMPTPKDFEDLRKAGNDTAAEAWGRAQKFASRLYSPTGYRQGSIGDEAIDTAVRAIGGYPAIAMCDTDKLHFLERRFSERYAELRDVLDTRAAVPQIASPRSTEGLTHVGRLFGKLSPPVAEEGRDSVSGDGRALPRVDAPVRGRRQLETQTED